MIMITRFTGIFLSFESCLIALFFSAVYHFKQETHLKSPSLTDINFLSSNSVDILFITETRLYNDIICHEVFSFNDFVVVSRCGRLSGNLGGVLIARRKIYSCNLLGSYSFRDISCSTVIKVNHMFFGLMVVNNPPLSSDYRVESSTLINVVQNHRDEVIKHIGRCPSDQTVFAVLGDFNLADVCWSSYYASSEFSMNILSGLDDLNLFQLVNFPTSLSDNTLDFFWWTDPQRFVVYRSKKTYSDHYPIFAHLHVSGDEFFKIDVSKQMYSNNRFDTERFSCLIELLSTKLFLNFQSDFLCTFSVLCFY